MSQSALEVTEVKRRKRRLDPPTPVAVTIDDACRLTGLGRTLIYELIAKQKLGTATVGRRRLVIYSSIEALLQQNVT